MELYLFIRYFSSDSVANNAVPARFAVRKVRRSHKVLDTETTTLAA